MARLTPITSSDTPDRPILDLSGEKLRGAAEALIKASEAIGGLEHFAAAARLKSSIFQERLANGGAEKLERARFEEIVPLMATVRRRVARHVDELGWQTVRSAIIDLLADAQKPGTGDTRISNFCARFPAGSRYVRDLAAELLHNTYPEQYPLMTRWVWDTKTNTGVIREIWHGDDVDHIVIDVPDNVSTFMCLREELSQFLSDNGIFRDMIWYVDVLEAQIYGDYINAQGGAYLKTDFSAAANPLEQSWRILGLDRIEKRWPGKTIDGAHNNVVALHSEN